MLNGSELTYFCEYPSPAMGSWLSKAFHAITGTQSSGDKATAAAHASIEGSLNLLITQNLAASCKSAPSADILTSLQTMLTQYDAYTSVQTSPDVVSAIMAAVVADLSTKGKIISIPGCGAAVVPVASSSGSNTAATSPTSVTGLTLSPTVLLLGGAGLLGVLLLTHHHGR